jgi:predicted 2-oxoglutarate/Fe(II)-dependent dioxygenase YbiX
MPLVQLGVAAPWFQAPTHSNPRFAFSSVAGRYILLVFLPQDAAAATAMASQVLEQSALFDRRRVMAFLVVRDKTLFEAQVEQSAIRWFLDIDGAVSRLYGAVAEDGSETPHWLLLDPSLRGRALGRLDDPRRLPDLLRALPEPDQHAAVPLTAPVLILPRVLEPDICRQLIAYYEVTGGAPSGVMREIGGKTVGVLDDFKKRRDATIQDASLRDALRVRIEHRLLPEIRKAFQFTVTRMERYIVAAYDAEEGGYFRPHRDNTTAGTAHRQFACSINLNAEDFEGGDLRFPEFGSRTYRPPTGGAVVFSCSLLHEATPVTKGRRYAFLPFFYNEAAAQVRAQNLIHLAQPHDIPSDDAAVGPADA